jgi:hypothetical protein
MSGRLFISHANEDAVAADHIVTYLESHGVPCWISSRDIPPQMIYADAISEAVQECTACAVVVSQAANQSKAECLESRATTSRSFPSASTLRSRHQVSATTCATHSGWTTATMANAPLTASWHECKARKARHFPLHLHLRDVR